MQINNVLTGFSDPTPLGKRGEPAETAVGRLLKTDESRPASGQGATATAARILAHYDVHNISPSDFSTMAQKLHDGGAVTDAELQELTAIRQDLDAAGVGANQKVDLVDFYNNKIRQAQQQAKIDKSVSRVEPLMRRAQWVQKFALIQSQPGAAGINALA